MIALSIFIHILGAVSLQHQIKNAIVIIFFSAIGATISIISANYKITHYAEIRIEKNNYIKPLLRETYQISDVYAIEIARENLSKLNQLPNSKFPEFRSSEIWNKLKINNLSSFYPDDSNYKRPSQIKSINFTMTFEGNYGEEVIAKYANAFKNAIYYVAILKIKEKYWQEYYKAIQNLYILKDKNDSIFRYSSLAELNNFKYKLDQISSMNYAQESIDIWIDKMIEILRTSSNYPSLVMISSLEQLKQDFKTDLSFGNIKVSTIDKRWPKLISGILGGFIIGIIFLNRKYIYFLVNSFFKKNPI